MATPNRKGVGESGEGLDSAQRARLWVRDLGGEGGGPSSTPSPAKVRQAQRRYRSLFQKAAKEYQLWCEGEEDSQRAMRSTFHLLDRLQILEGDPQTEDAVNLGGLEHLPGCRALLIRKHTVELESVTRLWRSLLQQMRSQVSLVEEALAEAWRLHRSEAKPRPPSATGVERSPSSVNAPRLGESAEGNIISSPSTPSSVGGLGNGKARAREMWGFPTMKGDWGAAVGPAEHLQWLEELSSMLVHEQWRKEVLLSRVNFAPEEPSVRVREHVRAQWSSRSAESFLDRKAIDATFAAAQIAPFPKKAR